MKNKKRKNWIDTLRLLSILLVMLTHFVAGYFQEYLHYWSPGGPMRGLTGKFAVAVFCVLSGFFCVKKFTEKEVRLEKYTLKRYSVFVIPVFLVNAGVLVFYNIYTHFDIYSRFGLTSANYNQVNNMLSLIGNTLLFGAAIVPTFWCIKDFFLGNVLIGLVLNNYRTEKRKQALLIMAVLLGLLVTEQVWIFVIIAGGFAIYYISKKELKWLDNVIIKGLLLILAYILVRVRPEDTIKYFQYAIAGILLYAVISHSNLLKRILSVKPLSKCGQVSFELFLVHTPVNMFFSKFLIVYLCENMSVKSAFLISLTAFVVLSLIVAFVLHYIVKSLIPMMSKKIGKHLLTE